MSDRIRELMNVCRPEDLGTDEFSELREAASLDAELERELELGFEKDQAVAEELADVEVPQGLEARLLAALQAAAPVSDVNPTPVETRSTIPADAIEDHQKPSKKSRRGFLVGFALAAAAAVVIAVMLVPQEQPPLGPSELVRLGMQLRDEVRQASQQTGDSQFTWQPMLSAPRDEFPVNSQESGVRVPPSGWSKIRSKEFPAGVVYDVSSNHVSAILFVFPKGDRQVSLSLGGQLQRLPEASGGYIVAAKQTEQHVYLFVLKGDESDFKRWTVSEGDLAFAF